MDIPIFDTYLTDEKICEIIQSVVFPFLKRYDSCKSYYGYLNKTLRLDECGIEQGIPGLGFKYEELKNSVIH